MFAAIFQTPKERADFIARMKEKEIVCPFHYVPLHTSPFGRSFYDGDPKFLPGCERMAQCLVRFPLYYNLSDDEQSHVIDSAKNILDETCKGEVEVVRQAVPPGLAEEAAKPLMASSPGGVLAPQESPVQEELTVEQS